ncbi:hypothetical protein MRX96_013648 [Rhipicephalus microplus]
MCDDQYAEIIITPGENDVTRFGIIQLRSPCTLYEAGLFLSLIEHPKDFSAEPLLLMKTDAKICAKKVRFFRFSLLTSMCFYWDLPVHLTKEVSSGSPSSNRYSSTGTSRHTLRRRFLPFLIPRIDALLLRPPGTPYEGGLFRFSVLASIFFYWDLPAHLTKEVSSGSHFSHECSFTGTSRHTLRRRFLPVLIPRIDVLLVGPPGTPYEGGFFRFSFLASISFYWDLPAHLTKEVSSGSHSLHQYSSTGTSPHTLRRTFLPVLIPRIHVNLLGIIGTPYEGGFFRFSFLASMFFYWDLPAHLTKEASSSSHSPHRCSFIGTSPHNLRKRFLPVLTPHIEVLLLGPPGRPYEGGFLPVLTPHIDVLLLGPPGRPYEGGLFQLSLLTSMFFYWDLPAHFTKEVSSGSHSSHRCSSTGTSRQTLRKRFLPVLIPRIDVLLLGPPGTPYEGGFFRFSILASMFFYWDFSARLTKVVFSGSHSSNRRFSTGSCRQTLRRRFLPVLTPHIDVLLLGPPGNP